MSNNIKLVLPYHYIQKFKTKKDKKIMVALNWYRNVNFFLNNQIKKYYYELVREQMASFKYDRLQLYRIDYKLYYSNKRSDMMNVIAVIDKYLQDALQKVELVEEDNVEHCKEINCIVAGRDNENPRVEIEISEVIK